MAKPFYALITICLLSFLQIHAQDNNLPSQWTLENCIDYAKKRNIQVNSLRLNERSTQEDLLQSRAAQLPFVSGSLSQNLVNGKNANTATGGYQAQSTVSGNYAINSSLTIYNGGYLKNDIKSKTLSTESANLSVEEAENDISLTVTQAYLNILLAKENITYLQDLLATSQAQLKQGQQRFDAGSISKKDLVQLEAQVANDQYNLVSAQNNFRINIVNLKQVLQLPSAYDFSIAEPDTVVVEKAVPALSEAQNMARATRPEVKNSEIGLNIAEAELEKTRASVKPVISLGAAFSTGYADNQTSKYVSQLNNNFYQSLGVTVGIPIFSRRVNKTNIAKSKIQIDQAKLALQNTKTMLDQQVEHSYINMQNAQAQYDAAETQMKASEESYKITGEQLRLGSINLVELQQQKTLYVQAMQAFIQAKYAAVLNYKIYQFYTGKPIEM